MANCLNLNIPEVKKAYNELTSIFNPNIAYAILSKNNGYGLEFNLQGNPSQLFNDLLQLPSKTISIPFNYGNNKELVLQGKKTMTSRNSNFLNMIPDESRLMELEGEKFIVKYFGELTHESVKNVTGKDYSTGEAFKYTTKGSPIEQSTVNYIKGIGTKHIYTINKVSQLKQRREAIKEKALIYTPGFLNENNWVETGEPTIFQIEEFKQRNSKSKLNTYKYNSTDVPFVTSNEENLGTTINEIDVVINQGVKAFTMNTQDKLSTTDSMIRNHFLVERGFDYTERDGVGFYTAPISEKKKELMKQEENSIKLNGVEINLNKLGFPHKLTNDQKQSLQDIADWVDGKELKQKAKEVYEGTLSDIKKGEVLVYSKSTQSAAEKLGATKFSGFQLTKQNKNVFGLKTREDVINLYELAREYPNLKFKVAKMSDAAVDFFTDSGTIPSNVIFEKEFSEKVYAKIPNMAKGNMALIGYAGTGKSSIVQIIIEYINIKRKPVIVSALTHRASRVQKEFYGDTVDTMTTHSATGLQGDATSEKNLAIVKGSTRFVVNPKNVKVFDGITLISDEASMTSKKMYNHLMSQSKELGYKILFVGDPKQIKAVGSSGLSPALKSGDKFITQLSTVVRQGNENSLQSTAIKFRRNQKTSTNVLGNTVTTDLNSDKTKGIEWATKNSFIETAVKLLTDDRFYKNPNFARLIAYKNATVDRYNSIIRQAMGRKEEFEVGEIMFGKYNNGSIINGADYRVTAKKDTTRIIQHPNNPDIQIETKGTILYLQDAMFKNNKTSVFVVSRYNMQETKIALAKIAAELRSDAITTPPGRLKNSKWRKYFSFRETFQMMEDVEIPGGGDQLIQTINYGYSITAHKSQGGTYDYVLADINDMMTRYDADIEEANQLIYTSMSRPNKGLIALVNAKIENVDSFDFSQKKKGEELEMIIDTIDLEVAEALMKDGIAKKYC